MLDALTRAGIEEAFGARVFDVYGCTEVKEIAWQCPTRDGYHVNADWLIVECLEAGNRHGRPPGTVLVTCLYNFAMPLLRYEVGDTGEVLPVPCRCGRGLPLIRPTWGRSVDYLRLPAGGSITPYSLTLAIEHIEGIRQFQIIQEDLRTVEMRVVPDDSFGEAEAEAARAALGAVLPGVRVMVRRFADLPHEASGKFRKVVSKVPTEQALAEPG
jgi:phenylacetate-CoA ligase